MSPRPSPFAGTSVITSEQRRAMERVLVREVPLFAVRLAAARAEAQAVRAPRSAAAPAPLPIWTPPTTERHADPEPCPNCGEESAVTRIDLTANAGWLICRACGLRWGGSIDSRGVELPELSPPDDVGERGHVVAG